MKAVLNIAWMIAAAVIGFVVWSQRQDYQLSHTDHAYHAQCPDPTRQYFDCDWWPKKD